LFVSTEHFAKAHLTAISTLVSETRASVRVHACRGIYLQQ